MAPRSVRERLADPGLKSWDEFDSYSQALLEIALNVPVAYFEDWMPEGEAEKVGHFTQGAEQLNFSVTIDGTDLRKPTVLRGDADGLLVRSFAYKGQHVGAQGYLYSGARSIRPTQLNGVLLRIRNAAVGGYDRTFLRFPGTTNALFQDWTSGELWADDRLEDALNIDRRTLRVTHPAYVEIRSAFHLELTDFLNTVRRTLYGARSARRRHEQADKQAAALSDVGTALRPHIGSRAAQQLVDEWGRSSGGRHIEVTAGRGATPRPRSEDRLLTRTYTSAQILQVVADAGREADLDGPTLGRLLQAVGRLLRA